ncbi:hypothetical protein [Sphingomonas morindae]|nr:hypothetical protein [Sphingomonas morindae]
MDLVDWDAVAAARDERARRAANDDEPGFGRPRAPVRLARRG